MICETLDRLCCELDRGAAALLIAEEALGEGDPRPADFIARQPPWSDLPVLVLTHQGVDSAAVAGALRTLGNVTLLERPLRVAALSSAVRSALRARERQYQARTHLEQLQEADRRKDAFLATLAHELRNPLAPIRNSVSALRLADPGDATPRVLDTLERQVTHVTRLVDDLMDASRMSLGKVELRKQAVDLAAVVGAAVEAAQPLIDSMAHEFAVTLPEDPLVVEADTVRLAQVFSNLLSNAAKYTDPSGRIELRVARDGERAVVAVRDSGIGIAAEVLPHVFEMFAQADAREGRIKSGLGIGLTLARDLVQLHGGSITASSGGLGRGSEFTVRLPLAGQHAVPAEAPRDSTVGLAKVLPRVLVVDDNVDSADSMGLLLEMLGASVSAVYSGSAALEAIDAFRPRVMLIDLGMPGMDGYELARRIRERADAAEIVLVALTGWGNAGDRQLTQAAGFAHHLVKPADIGALHALLESL